LTRNVSRVLVPSDPSLSLRAADLFCGAGGLTEGLRQAGFRVVVAADHDPDACATYRLNFPGTALLEGDLTADETREALVDAATAVGPLDLLAGGPPCQAFSQVRNHDRLIEDPRNRLYREFVHLLGELRPAALLLENVPGMNQLQGGAVRRQIEEDLSLEGDYHVVSGVLDAGDFGTPQCRPRLVFLGLRADIGTPELPEGTGVVEALRLDRRNGSGYAVRGGSLAGHWLLDVLRDHSDARAVTASQALSDLILPGEEYATAPQSAFQRLVRQGSSSPQHHTPSRIREDTVRRLRAIPPGGNVYDLPSELLGRYLNGAKWGPAGDGKRLSRRHYYAYRRLHPDWLAWTANTKADFAYHYEQPRGLSAREAARIQGFPDCFHITVAPKGTPGKLYGGDRHSIYRQVGNAVPPPLAAALARTLAARLARLPEPAAATA
jgi:DNA (cytosine-5)-methyltransferase 1